MYGMDGYDEGDGVVVDEFVVGGWQGEIGMGEVSFKYELSSDGQ